MEPVDEDELSMVKDYDLGGAIYSGQIRTKIYNGKEIMLKHGKGT